MIRRYVAADGGRTQDVSVEGPQQEPVAIQEGDTVSRVTKRTVLRSEGQRKEVGVSCVPEHLPQS